MFDFEPGLMNIHWLHPLREKFLSNGGGAARECAILDVINRMRRHVPDNRMILNLLALYFGATPTRRRPCVEFERVA